MLNLFFLSLIWQLYIDAMQVGDIQIEEHDYPRT